MADTPSVENTADTRVADPSDTPLLTVLRHYESEGYAAQFDARESGRIRCFSCDTDSNASECGAGPIRRLEGASDPSDMLAVLPVACPQCEAKGTIVANYGPEATPADAALLLAIEPSDRALGAGDVPA